jgi:hypothetical protein
VSFVDEQGSAVVNYAGLKVWDADNQELPARIDVNATGVRLVVNERGARYPLTIDPIAQQAYLKASNPDWDDWFGWSVAVSGDTVVVGAYLEDSSDTGVDGNQADNSAGDSGVGNTPPEGDTGDGDAGSSETGDAEAGSAMGGDADREAGSSLGGGVAFPDSSSSSDVPSAETETKKKLCFAGAESAGGC